MEKRVRGFKDSRGQVIVKAFTQKTLTLKCFYLYSSDFLKNICVHLWKSVSYLTNADPLQLKHLFLLQFTITINRGGGKYKNSSRKSIVFLDRTGIKRQISINRIKPKLSVSNFKRVSNIFFFNVIYLFIFLKFETLRDCRSYRIYCVRCRPA